MLFDFKDNPTISKLKEIIPLLHEFDMNVNSSYSDIHGLSLLHIRQPYETMKYLLDIGGNPNLNSLILELKPIHFQYDYKTIKLLIDRGAQPNPVDVNYFNPLFWQKDLESAIYECGGSFNAYTSKSSTVFFIDASKKCLEKTIDIISDAFYHSLFHYQLLTPSL